MGADETDFGFGAVLFNGLGDLAIVFERWSRSMDDDVVVGPGFFQALLDIDVVRRAIHQFRIRHQGGGLGQPGGIPKAGYFASRLITGSGTSVETIKAGRG